MFSFFQRKTIVSDISWLGVDIHSHLLPGIDDGSASMENSLAYIHKLQELGFEKLICTPHIFTDLYPNTPETILPVLHELRAKVKSEGLNVELAAAAEYMADNSFKVEPGLLTLPRQHILIEMSYLAETPNIDQIIFELHVQGYKVVLAHPERYLFYHKNFERYKRLKELGCLLQLNLLSVTGYYGKSVKSAAEAILKAGLYDCAGTDLHHERHLAVLEKNVQNGKMYELIGNYEFKNKELFI
jgi:protein-tyrosine phosphatase